VLKKYRLAIALFLGIVIVGISGIFIYEKWEFNRQRSLERQAIRSLHRYIEEFMIRKLEYPMALDSRGKPIPFNEGFTFGGAPWNRMEKLKVVPEVVEKVKQCRYIASTDGRWVVAHPGPDGILQSAIDDLVISATEDLSFFLAKYPEAWIEYDPTNGGMSSGDILRSGP